MLALGLMSGTSLDGVDAALIETDGFAVTARPGFLFRPYDDGIKRRIREVLGQTDRSALAAIEAELTDFHADVVCRLLHQQNLGPKDVSVIGFHGHTISHDPSRRHTLQIGDGDLLATLTQIKVVDQLRIQDVKAGGQGAPLVPIYHQAMVRNHDEPTAVLNLGGVANVTLLPQMLAFDTGPANALLDDWALLHTGLGVDLDGRLSGAGRVQSDLVERFVAHDYFHKTPPKSLDRDEFKAFANSLVPDLNPEDGAATLAAFTARSVAVALVGQGIKHLYVCGGGRHNPTIMKMIAAETGLVPKDVAELGLNGDAIEAEAFAYLAVRSLANLPITFPGTTGVAHPMTGGTCHEP